MPVGRQQQHGQSGEAAAQIAHCVQRGLVGPVHVLEDEQHRRVGQRRPGRSGTGGSRLTADGRAASSSAGSASRNRPSAAAVVTLSAVPNRTASGPSTRSDHLATNVVLPTPASPPTKTSRPEPRTASSASGTSAATYVSRSTSIWPLNRLGGVGAQGSVERPVDRVGALLDEQRVRAAERARAEEAVRRGQRAGVRRLDHRDSAEHRLERAGVASPQDRDERAAPRDERAD